MRDDDLDLAMKVVIVGNGAVGKSSMIQRFCRGLFTREYKKTIGVDFLERVVDIDNDPVRLMLWDTAGQEEFDAITKAYYRGAQAAVLTFSTVDRISFLAVKHWKKKVEDECGSIPMVLVQNKIDLLSSATIDPSEAESLARELRIRLYRTSVKEDLNVYQLFTYLAERYLAEVRSWEEDNFSPTTVIYRTDTKRGDRHLASKLGKYDPTIISLASIKRHKCRKRFNTLRNICIL